MKDYSKLRPFDLEAARDRGDLLTSSSNISQGNPVWKYAAGPDSEGKIIAIVLDDGHFANPASTNAFRMAPLAWVRKSADEDVLWPVYKGDVLWHPSKGKCKIDLLMSITGHVAAVHEYGVFSVLHSPDSDALTFTPPKVKREGWGVINKASLVATKEEAEHYRNRQLGNPDRFVVVKAEWEE